MLYISTNIVVIMSKTSMLAVRIDPDIKAKAEKLYASFGLNLSDAVSMFIHQSLLVKGLPFELRMPVFKGEFSLDDGSFKEEPAEISIDELREIVRPIAKKYDLKSLYLIGSRARGDNRPDSDYDFCFEMKRPSAIKAAGLMGDLSKAVNMEIDLVNKNSAEGEMLDNIKKDGILIYEG